jgi:hypothetical protein
VLCARRSSSKFRVPGGRKAGGGHKAQSTKRKGERERLELKTARGTTAMPWTYEYAHRWSQGEKSNAGGYGEFQITACR